MNNKRKSHQEKSIWRIRKHTCGINAQKRLKIGAVFSYWWYCDRRYGIGCTDRAIRTACHCIHEKIYQKSGNGAARLEEVHNAKMNSLVL